jgi:hypothetical protein
MRLLTFTILLLALIPACVVGQTTAATKFDSYGRLTTDDEAAHLDLFEEQLRTHPELRGYLVGYNQPTIAPGVFLRRLYGDQRYLVEARGLTPDRIAVVDGGYRSMFTFELWLVRNDQVLPAPTATSPPRESAGARELFDEECLECSPAVFLDLYAFSDGLKFYAATLQNNLPFRGLIVVRPGQDISARGALNRALKAKRLLIRTYKIDARRLTIKVARRRKDNMSTAEMWIIK